MFGSLHMSVLMRNYSWVLKAFAAEQSNVVERRIVPSLAIESAVAESVRMEVDHILRRKGGRRPN